MTATVLLEVPFSARGDRIPDAVAELRTREPIRKVRTITGAEAWLVSSYALCTQVLEDRRFSMKETAAAGAPRLNALTVPPEVVNNMGNIADAGLRKAVMKAITPKAPGLEQFLRDTANSLLDNLITEGAQPICAMTSPTRWPLPCTARFWASRKKTARSCSVA
ncbi:cytochrome P450 121 CYP121 [Mycobacterium tuberculosis]|nr:cytochrome P450 121 CYP121 [Mycobacterium tuberculosis]